MKTDDMILVSVDDHVVEPAHMFDGRVERRFAEAAPRFVRRDDGTNDVGVSHDCRLLVGWERRPADLGVSWRLEAGWVTGRLVEYYLTDTGDYRPGDTALVRAGVWY